MLAYITALLCNIESSTIGVLTLMAPIVGSALGASPSIMLIVAAVVLVTGMVPRANADLTSLPKLPVGASLAFSDTFDLRQDVTLDQDATTSSQRFYDAGSYHIAVTTPQV